MQLQNCGAGSIASWSNGDVLLAMALIASGTTHLATENGVLRRHNKLRPLRERRKQ
jgi:hypothetical protein